VYIGSCNGIVRALEFRTGRVRWETKVSPDSDQYFFHGDPLIAGGVIVAGADRPTGASIHALDRLTGKELWKHPAGRGVNGPIAGSGGRVYAARYEGQLLSLDIGSGDVRWAVDLKVSGMEGPAADGRQVFAGAVDGVLHGLNADTGREEWRVNLGAPVSTTVTVSAGDVGDLYVGTADGEIHRVDANRGRVLGSRKLDPMLKPASVPVRTADSVLVLLVDQSADYRAVVSLDPALDDVRWRVAADKSWSTSRIFVWGDVVVLGTAAGNVDAYCAKTGVPAWSRSIKGRVRSVGGAEDILLVGTPNGDLYAMRAPRSCDAK
jgi:outer membrane protein assembly factor BamB